MKAIAAYIDMLIAMPIAVLAMVVFVSSMHSLQNTAYSMSNHSSEMYWLYALSQEISSVVYQSHLNYSASLALASSLAMNRASIALHPGMYDTCSSTESCRFLEIGNKTYTMVISSESSN